VDAILKQFGGVDAEIQEIDRKPERAHPPNFKTKRSVITDTAPISQHRKVWIDGVGFMKQGRRLTNGQNSISDRMMAHGG
jgi:hypothetical protein